MSHSASRGSRNEPNAAHLLGVDQKAVTSSLDHIPAKNQPLSSEPIIVGAADASAQPIEVRQHAVGKLATVLGAHLGITCDPICLVELLSLIGGSLAMPINLDIVTPEPTARLFVANGILRLAADKVHRINQLWEFQKLEQDGFRDCWAVLVRGGGRTLFREATEIASQVFDENGGMPSIWRIAEEPPRRLGLGPTLRVVEIGQPNFRGLAERLIANASCNIGTWLGSAIAWKERPSLRCSFRDKIRSSLRPEEKLIVERMLGVVATVRLLLDGAIRKIGAGVIELGAVDGTEIGEAVEISGADYCCVRSLLIDLPVPDVSRQLTPEAVSAAAVIYERVHRPGYQCYLPDESTDTDWFKRGDAVLWTSKSYNTVKSYLEAMKDDGLLVATKAENGEQRGKEIHYRFVEGVRPPFVTKNPFEYLPALSADECSDAAQS